MSRFASLLPGVYSPLFANRHFRRLMPVFTVSDLGDGMSTVAVAWLALTITPLSSQGIVVGAAVAAYVLPGALGAVVLGRWVRRLSARRLLVADSSLRSIALAAIPLTHTLGVLSPALYVTLLAASSLLHAWGIAGRHAVFAPLLPGDQRLAANAVLSTSTWSSIIAGPALAGLLISAVSPAWIIGVDALTFAVLAVRAAATTLPDDAQPTGENAVEGTLTGLRVFLNRPELLWLLIVTWLFNASFGPVEVALPLFVVEDLQAGVGILGTYWAAFGIGAVVGALSLGALRRLPLWPVMLGIIAGHGVGMLTFIWQTHWVPSLVGFTLAGVIYGPYSALSFTLLQERAPAPSLTTVLAARTAVLLTASPMGAAAAGPLTNIIGARNILVGSGISMIILAVAAALAPLGLRARARSQPQLTRQ
jgi:MFS family permease